MGSVCQESLPLVHPAVYSNMVLQRMPHSARVFGWTKTAQETVSVTFNGKMYKATSDVDMQWKVELPPTPASFNTYTITVDSQQSGNATLTNILFGDVFWCSGQSNMEFRVLQNLDSKVYINQANDYPNIRITRANQAYSNSSVKVPNIGQSWTRADNTSIGSFSAVCWFFGRDYYDTYKVPVGLIESSYGGTIIESWSSPDALKNCPHTPKPKYDSTLWNAMVQPFLNVQLRAMLWYQGENNCIAQETAFYTCAQPAMISDYREKWGYTSEQLPFLYVQIVPDGCPGNHNTDLGYPEFVSVSQISALKLDNVAMAVTLDLDIFANGTKVPGGIHPQLKPPVSKRLLTNWKYLADGKKEPRGTVIGPTMTSMKVLSEGPNAQVQIDFDPETIGDGLTIHPRECTRVPRYQWTCAWGNIEATTSFNATLSLTSDNKSLILSADIGQNKLTGASYAWGLWPLPIVFNSYGLPMQPFKQSVTSIDPVLN